MFSEDGQLVWAATYRTWGAVHKIWQADNDNDVKGAYPPPIRGNLAFKYDTVEAIAAQTCPIRFQGQWEDAETGLYYNRFRYYDPLAGQYLSPDPIGLEGGTRPQGYVHNPNTWIDPWGLAAKENIVYRALTQENAESIRQGEGLTAKNPNGIWTATEHVANSGPGSGGAAKNSPWISTTTLGSVADAYNSGYGIAIIDLNKAPSLQIKVWETAPRSNGVQGLPYHRSIWSQEVDVFQYIPQEAIIGVK